MPFQVFDIWDQAALTEEITRPPAGRDPGAAEDTGDRGQEIAPDQQVGQRTVKARVRELKPFGLAQFRAPGQTPAFFDTGLSWQEKVISLVLIEEQHPIEDEEWIKLNSPDENVIRSAGVELVERGRQMRLRQDRRKEDMRWKMLLNGSLVISYPNAGPNGATIEIDYGFTAGHKPSLSAGAKWTAVSTADPVADVQTWSEVLADDSGFYARYLWMNDKTFDLLIRNQKIISTINFFAAGANAIQRPRQQDILEMFSSFFVGQSIERYNNGYRDVGETGIGRPSLTKYLPDYAVLVCGPYVVDGTPVAETLNGPVLINGQNLGRELVIKQGFQAEAYVDPYTHTTFMRAASSAMPRLNYPEVVLSATVSS